MMRAVLACLLAAAGLVVGTPRPAVAAVPARVILWANVEGASHTRAGGDDPGRASGVARMAIMARVIVAHRADIVVLSELERVQAAAFTRDTAGRYGLVYPGRDTRNAIGYRHTAYRLIGRGYRVVPYFNGHRHRIPVAWLEDRATHAVTVVIAVHNPADTRRFPRQGRWRALALNLEIAAVDRLAHAHPRAGLVLAGDFNARRPVLEAVIRRTPLVSPIRAGARVPIDQCFTGRATTAAYHRWTSARITRATDHRAVYTVVFRHHA